MRTVIERFVEAVARADAAGIAATLDPDAELRALVPGNEVEAEGGDAVAARFVAWFGGYDARELLSHGRDRVGTRTRVTYRLRVTRNSASWLVEQHAFCTIEDERITRIDLVCSGFHPFVERAGDGRLRYEAGDQACTDGLQESFRRALGQVPLGDVLVVHASDASARVELPSFARLLGNEVRSVTETGDGAVLVAVERRK